MTIPSYSIYLIIGWLKVVLDDEVWMCIEAIWPMNSLYDIFELDPETGDIKVLKEKLNSNRH